MAAPRDPAVQERRLRVALATQAGLTQKQIAETEGVSPSSVENDIRLAREAGMLSWKKGRRPKKPAPPAPVSAGLLPMGAPPPTPPPEKRRRRRRKEAPAPATEPPATDSPATDQEGDAAPARSKVRAPSVAGLVPNFARERRCRPERMPDGWDGPTAYYRGIVEGRIVAGAPMRNEAARHLADIGDPRWRWEPARAWALFRFMERCAPTHDYRVVPFVQAVFGRWIGLLHADGPQAGRRRFQQVFLVSGRKSGKTLASAMALWWGVLADGEQSPECFVVARDERQAGTAFRDVISCFQKGFVGNLEPTASDWRVVGGISHARQVRHLDPTAGFIELRSGQAKAMIGTRPHFALLDEYAQHIDDSMQEAVDQGFGNRTQPVMLTVTNAGETEDCPAGAAYRTAKAVAAGETEMETLLPCVFEVDEDDDPLDPDQEACWAKAEPAIDEGFPTRAFVRKEVSKARANPAKAASVLRMLFGRWVSSDESWLPIRRWTACERDDYPAGIERWRCYGGLDLSQSTDLTAAALVWVEPGDEMRMWAEVHVWTPKKTMAERERADRAPYGLWESEGHLTAVPGGEMIDLEWVAGWWADAAERYRLEGIAYDRYRMPALRQVMLTLGIRHSPIRRERGLWLIECPQNFVLGSGALTKIDRRRGGVRLFMPRCIDETERAVRDGRLRLRPSPPLRMALNGVRMVADEQRNRRFSKKGHARTDAAVALTMAVGFAVDDRVNRSGSEISAEDEADLLTYFGAA